MTTRIPNAVGVWHETPEAGAAVALSRMYWHYDSGTSTWTLTNNPFRESGRLVDNDGDGTFVLTLLASVLPAAPALRQSRRADGTTLVY